MSVSPTSAAPGHGLTLSGSGWPAGDTIFVQIGSTTFDTEVVCALVASPDGTIAGNKTNGNCAIPNAPAGSRVLFAIDQQNQGVIANGTTYKVIPGLTLTPSGAAGRHSRQPRRDDHHPRRRLHRQLDGLGVQVRHSGAGHDPGERRH